MTKFLKPKNMRRLALLATLAAPAVYLFGSLFTGLIGAHGEIVYASEGDSSYVAVTDTENIPSSEYCFVWDKFMSSTDVSSAYTLPGTFRSGNQTFRQMLINADHVYYYLDTPNSVASTAWDNNGWKNGWDVIYFTADSFPSFPNILSKGQLMAKMPTANSNAEFVFSQMFPEDNFISKLGDDVFTGNISSQPISQLISYVDSNMFEIGDTSIGRFVYGYTYYAITSVLIYEIVAIALSLLLLPLKIVDTLEKGDMS